MPDKIEIETLFLGRVRCTEEEASKIRYAEAAAVDAALAKFGDLLARNTNDALFAAGGVLSKAIGEPYALAGLTRAEAWERTSPRLARFWDFWWEWNAASLRRFSAFSSPGAR